VPVIFDGGFAAGEGSEAFAGGKPLGRISSVVEGGRALAMLRLDRVEDALAAGHRLEAGGLQFRLAKPDYARFPFPGDPDKPVA
jgi:hypothetical protein